jgi:hypothetical protein
MLSKHTTTRHLDLVVLLLSLAPPLVTLTLVLIYGVNIPIGDQWDFVPLLKKSFSGGLTFYDFWIQHNEHRLIFPRLIMLGLAKLTGWNIIYELMVNIVLAVTTYILLAAQIASSRRVLKIQGVNWIVPAISITVFSLSQWENWLWGWQLQIFLNVLAVVAGIMALSAADFKWSRFALAILLGIIAAYSFANGMIYWIVGLAIISLLQIKRSQKLAALTVWLALSALIACSYLYGYHKPGHHPQLYTPFSRPLEFAEYFFMYLGNPIRIHALFAGIFGSAIIIFLVWYMLRRRQISIQVLLPYLSMAAYAVGSALITAMSRVGFGTGQSLSSRYITISNLFWICILCLFYLSIAGRNNSAEPRQKKGSRFRPACKTTLVIVMIAVVLNSLAGYPLFRSSCADRQYARDTLLEIVRSRNSAESPCVVLKYLYTPEPDKVLRESKILYQHHLSLFH